MMKEIFNINTIAISLTRVMAVLLILAVFSCKKGEIIGEDPYAGGKQALGIKFDNVMPDPELAIQGSEVKIFVRGLKKFENKFKLYVNEIEATVVSFTDSTAVIKVPDNASTGGLSVYAENQTFFGPVLKIDGRVSIDATFSSNGATFRGSSGGISSATIYDIATLPNGNSFLVGSFNNFDNRWTEKIPNGGIAQISSTGAYVVPAADAIDFGKGANGPLRSIIRLTSGPHNGKYIVSGLFSSYNSTRSNRLNINGITRLNANGTLDSTMIDVINPTPNEVRKNRDTIPSFNGGVDGTIVKSFVFGDRLYAVGNFQNYVRRFYERSTYDTKVLDLIKMRQMVCLKINQTNSADEGDLDLNFHYDPLTKQSPIGANGAINDAIQLPNGKLVLVGAFTTFNGVPANRIVCINLDGSVDQTFSVGNGADQEIVGVTYNAVTNKILVSGLFRKMAGADRQGVAMLDANGSLTTAFNFGTLTEGVATYAGQLNGGKVIVSGTFKTYNGVIRQGFMILNSDGSLAAGYNNTGQFTGAIEKIVETTSGATTRVTLIGTIIRFDSTSFKGILRILIRN
ncbi:MAG: DUF5008 domain-containing protein [Pedobacter sp.]|uniref:DUF5008 domain-containing protein n=1 Tax=Pedobacter sp. TaxID=1411316 RepID=UPI0028080160|nr:DUF5008 domain-containing protein [Pedobacter sp.]MDQ8006694.1 DUF5008 domain-containing protein [Pedobacter sp.]